MSKVALTWIDPTTRADAAATPLSPTDIDHIDIYDAVDGAASAKIASVHGAATAFTTADLAPGSVHVFDVVVVDVQGNSSAPSNSFSVTMPVPLAPPAAATDLTGTIVN
jgi:hypothetical protein